MKEDLAKTLSDAFPNVSVELIEVNKLQGQSYTGLSIKHDESAVAPSINLNQFYEKHEDGSIYEDVLQNLTYVVVTSFSYTSNMIALQMSRFPKSGCENNVHNERVAGIEDNVQRGLGMLPQQANLRRLHQRGNRENE